MPVNGSDGLMGKQTVRFLDFIFMKQVVKFLTMFLLALTVALALPSCDKDDNEPNSSSNSGNNDSDSEKDDPDTDAFQVVGKWNGEYGGTKYILTIDENGYYAITDGNTTKTSSWSYDKGLKAWFLYNQFGFPMTNKYYRLVGGQLHATDGMIVFSRGTGGSDNPTDQPCDDARIYGTWTAKDYTDSFVVTFDKTGSFTEEYSDGSFTSKEDGKYTLKNGVIDFGDTYPVFANTVGNPPFTVSFSSGTTPSSMVIKSSIGELSFTRKK